MSANGSSQPHETPALRVLNEAHVNFQTHVFTYEEKGGTRVSSAKLGVDEHSIIKTLVFKTETGAPLIVLMHGDRQVDTKALAKQIGTKKVSSATPQFANEKTGYQVGGISPFGTKEMIPVYVEKTILDLPLIFINGGGRGFLVSFSASELERLLRPSQVNVAIEHKARA